MSLNRWFIVRRRDPHALTLSLALTATLVSCGGAQDTPAPGGDTLGAAGQGQIGRQGELLAHRFAGGERRDAAAIELAVERGSKVARCRLGSARLPADDGGAAR